MNKSDDYAYGIDALRFFAAMIVAVFHLTYRTVEGAMIMPFGWVGVEIFFVISGVVIANSAHGSSPRRFLIGRFLRLYPAAWIAGIVSFALMSSIPWDAYKEQGIGVVPQLGALARSMTLVGNYYISSAYWTLPIELAFYFLIFLALCTGGQLKLVAIARALIVLSSPYLIAAFCQKIGLLNLPWLEVGFGLTNMLLIRHGCFFALGIYIWYLTEGYPVKRTDLLLFLAASILATIEISTGAIHAAATDSVMSSTFLLVSCIMTFAMCTYGVYLSMRHRKTLRLAPSAKRVLRALGLVTYPLYLMHEALGGFILYHVTSDMAPYLVRVALAVAATIIAAYAVSAYGEPLLRNYLRALIPLLSMKFMKRQGARE